jgi:hypothetical protein
MVGRAELSPFPLGRTVITKPVLSQVALPFQTDETRWGE